MKVKIGELLYDSNDIPIMIILNDKEKQHITDMHPECTKYCSFPDDSNLEEIKEFMRTDK